VFCHVVIGYELIHGTRQGIKLSKKGELKIEFDNRNWWLWRVACKCTLHTKRKLHHDSENKDEHWIRLYATNFIYIDIVEKRKSHANGNGSNCSMEEHS